MKQVVSEQKRCECCGGIKEYAETEEICDECGKLLEWNKTSGYPFSLSPIYHNEESRREDLHYCSFECFSVWVAKNPNILWENDDFVSIYFHKPDLDKLKLIFQNHFTNGDKS